MKAMILIDNDDDDDDDDDIFPLHIWFDTTTKAPPAARTSQRLTQSVGQLALKLTVQILIPVWYQCQNWNF